MPLCDLIFHTNHYFVIKKHQKLFYNNMFYIIYSIRLSKRTPPRREPYTADCSSKKYFTRTFHVKRISSLSTIARALVICYEASWRRIQ